MNCVFCSNISVSKCTQCNNYICDDCEVKCLQCNLVCCIYCILNCNYCFSLCCLDCINDIEICNDCNEDGSNISLP